MDAVTEFRTKMQEIKDRAFRFPDLETAVAFLECHTGDTLEAVAVRGPDGMVWVVRPRDGTWLDLRGYTIVAA